MANAETQAMQPAGKVSAASAVRAKAPPGSLWSRRDFVGRLGWGMFAAFGGLTLLTGFDPLGRPDAEAALASRIQIVGLLTWLAGSWIVAGRFAVRGMAPPDRTPEPTSDVAPASVVVSHPRVTVADATRTRVGLRPNSASA